MGVDIIIPPQRKVNHGRAQGVLVAVEGVLSLITSIFRVPASDSVRKNKGSS